MPPMQTYFRSLELVPLTIPAASETLTDDHVL